MIWKGKGKELIRGVKDKNEVLGRRGLVSLVKGKVGGDREWQGEWRGEGGGGLTR